MDKATCPVCKMAVTDTFATPRTTHAGTTYLFCSEACQRAFERRPERFAAPAKGTA